MATSLFDRIGKRVILTEAGKVLLPRAQKLVRELDDARLAIQNLAQQVSGRLPIAASHHIGLHRLPPVLKNFSQRYPAVKMDISFLDSEQAYKQVLHGDIELAVVTLSLEAVQGIQDHTLWTDNLRIMTASDHPLSRFRQLQLTDLLDYPAILPGENTFTRQLIDDLFRRKQLQLQVEMSTNYLETIRMIVSIGMAWSVLPDIMREPGLTVLSLPNINLTRKLGFICHREHTLSNACRAFIGELEQHAD